MIENGEVDHFADKREAPGDALVGGTGTGVAARVVVGQDQPLATMPSGIGDNLTDWQFGAVGMPVVTRQMETARIAIDMCNP